MKANNQTINKINEAYTQILISTDNILYAENKEEKKEEKTTIINTIAGIQQYLEPYQKDEYLQKINNNLNNIYNKLTNKNTIDWQSMETLEYLFLNAHRPKKYQNPIPENELKINI